MDDLDLIRALRDDAPDAAAKAAALRALRARIDPPDAGASRRGAGGLASPRRTRLLATAAALAVAAMLVVALWPGGDGAKVGGGLAPASAEAALERAATAARATPDAPLRPGDYFYVRERTAYEASAEDAPGGGWSVIVPRERETWTDRTGAGRFVERATGPPRFRSARDREGVAAGSPPLSGPGGAEIYHFGAQRFGAGGSTLTYDQLAELPSDGRAMYDKLLGLARDAGPSPDAEAFTIIGDLLRSVPVPAHVRAGLYRAAAYIQDVRYAGPVTDELGRRGLAIDLVDGPRRHRLVFDPDTSQILMEDTITPGGDDVPDRLVLKQGIVPSETARP